MINSKTIVKDKWEDYPPNIRFMRLATAVYLESRKKDNESLTERDRTIIMRAAKVAEIFDYQHKEWHGHVCRFCQECELSIGFPKLFSFIESDAELSQEGGISLGDYQSMVMYYCEQADEDEKCIRFDDFCELTILQKYYQKVLDYHDLFDNLDDMFEGR